MTATDELRRLLDERGVKWMPSVWSAKDETFYKVGEIGYLATELSSGRMKVCIEGYPTHEQVIAATLGAGTCYDVCDDPNDFACSECGAHMFIETDDIYTMMTSDENIIKRPNHCPNCGARVVGVRV